MRSRRITQFFLSLTVLALVLVELSCSSEALKNKNQKNNKDSFSSHHLNQQQNYAVDSKVIQKKELDVYNPKQREYNFYFTYKIVHAWWDAVALGMEDAVRQYEEKGIHITYDYRAPENMSAYDQVQRIKKAAALNEYDVIGVDVADIDIVTPDRKSVV